MDALRTWTHRSAFILGTVLAGCSGSDPNGGASNSPSSDAEFPASTTTTQEFGISVWHVKSPHTLSAVAEGRDAAGRVRFQYQPGLRLISNQRMDFHAALRDYVRNRNSSADGYIERQSDGRIRGTLRSQDLDNASRQQLSLMIDDFDAAIDSSVGSGTSPLASAMGDKFAAATVTSDGSGASLLAPRCLACGRLQSRSTERAELPYRLGRCASHLGERRECVHTTRAMRICRGARPRQVKRAPPSCEREACSSSWALSPSQAVLAGPVSRHPLHCGASRGRQRGLRG
jgi:hypothetical protein